VIALNICVDCCHGAFRYLLWALSIYCAWIIFGPITRTLLLDVCFVFVHRFVYKVKLPQSTLVEPDFLNRGQRQVGLMGPFPFDKCWDQKIVFLLETVHAVTFYSAFSNTKWLNVHVKTTFKAVDGKPIDTFTGGHGWIWLTPALICHCQWNSRLVIHFLVIYSLPLFKPYWMNCIQLAN